MIPFTRPFLPPIEDYKKHIDDIYSSAYLTNNGPNVQSLEKRLSSVLEVDNCSFVTNGTIALQLAIKALGLKGEVITTPFSYVATTSSIVWEGCSPVYVDIDPDTLNIDVSKIEIAITKRTSAIFVTHCFGSPCDVETISSIAKKHKLLVIYDASHCFGTLYKGQSIFKWGDISTLSLHATKLIHSVEGGVVVSSNIDIHNLINQMRNFGHSGPYEINFVGINGKNCEFHAAMGLCVLKYAELILADRKRIYLNYLSLLGDLELKFQRFIDNSAPNFSYFPIILKNENLTKKILSDLESNKVTVRRYFYPALSTLPYVSKCSVPIAEDISKRIICLPMYHGLTDEQIVIIAKLIRNSILT